MIDKYYDEYENIIEYTYKELCETVDDWWTSMSDDAQYRWHINPSPIYEMYVLIDIEEGDKVLINFDKHTYEIIK